MYSVVVWQSRCSACAAPRKQDETKDPEVFSKASRPQADAGGSGEVYTVSFDCSGRFTRADTEKALTVQGDQASLFRSVGTGASQAKRGS